MTSFATHSRRTSTIVSIVGGVALIGLLVGAAVPSANNFRSFTAGDNVTSLDVSGAHQLDVDSGVSAVTVEFGDVSQAQLQVAGTSNRSWTLRMDAGTIHLGTSSTSSWCFGWCRTDVQELVLTLPQTLDGHLDAALSVQAGRLTATGNFSDLSMHVAAGQLSFTGSADTVETTVEVGQAIVDLREAPSRLDVTISAGEGKFTMPDEPYAITSNVSLGSLDNRLHTDRASARQIHAEVEIGSLTLTPRR